LTNVWLTCAEFDTDVPYKGHSTATRQTSDIAGHLLFII
jgi:hypothetical protein